MYAQYKYHNDATLSYMEDPLHCFHTFKDVFLLGQSGKKAKAKANDLKTELIKKQKVYEEPNAETWMPSKKQCEMNAWRDYISHKIDISKELDADFNFPKIYLISHWAEQIRQYGALQQYSAERHEQAHKTNLNVTPLVLQVYFGDHTRSLDNPNTNTQSEIMNYHSDFLIGSTFQIGSPIGNISITLPVYQWTNESDRAECNRICIIFKSGLVL